MNQFALSRRYLGIFILLYSFILVVSYKITESAQFATHSSLIWAVLFDLVIIPFGLFYFLVGKTSSAIRLVLVFTVLIRIALFIIPVQLSFWPTLIILGEATLLCTLLIRIRHLVSTFHKFRVSQSLENALTSTLEITFGKTLTPFICTEILVIYYGLFGYTLKNDISENHKVVTTHKNSAQTALSLTLLLVGFIETIVVHIMLFQWSPIISFCITGISFYGLLFILADFFTNFKRPSYLTHDTFQLRLGMRWKASIPVTLVDQISEIKEKPKKETDLLNASLLVSPNILITFKTTIKIDGPYGMERNISKLSLFVDNPSQLISITENGGN